MRRAVSRTLVVFGGAVAATAIAWAISSASASAETADWPAGPDLPVLTDLVAPVSDVSELASEPLRAISAVGRLGQPTPPPTPRPITDVGEVAKQAANEFGEHMAGHLQWLPELPIDGAASSDPAPGAGQPGATPIADRPTLTPIAGVGPGFDPDTLAERGAQDRAIADGMSRRGSPAPVLPGAPARPMAPPAAPTSMPGPGSTGQTGGGADSPAFAALSWLDGVTSPVSADALPATEAHLPEQGGAQPGHTPD